MCNEIKQKLDLNNTSDGDIRTFLDIFEKDVTINGQKEKVQRIVIPKIQRDFAQGRQEPNVKRIRDRFLESLFSAVTNKPIILDFVFGDLNGKHELMPLDGQQRLSTLFLLHWYAARKELIPEEECLALSNFSYETRFSARDFCIQLSKFSLDISSLPEKVNALSERIIDQCWFPLEWKKDPTISSMLVMLDDINEKFRGVSNLWRKLKDGAIRFCFLALPDMGLTDELYIKMNSRGKPLTMFEHFKAELDGLMCKADTEIAKRIMKKIDGSWNDLLWKYCKKDLSKADYAIPDNEFLNYFKFIFLLIHYRDNSDRFQRDADILDMTKRYFSEETADVKKNMLFLEKAFDCWCNLPNNNTPSTFLDCYISKSHEKEKIIAASSKFGSDIFNECLSSERLSLGKTVLLFAIIIFLQHQNTITDDDFRIRLRYINNLVQNSEDELAERSDNSRMKNILFQTNEIMKTGKINDTQSMSFNVYQLKEEKAKQEYIVNNPADKDDVYLLEDHPLLYGQIGIVGLENLKNAKSFCSLFQCNKELISRALMTIGDYGQPYSNGWRWVYGSPYNDTTWKELFHRSKSRDECWFNKTHDILNALLTKDNSFSDKKLNCIIEYFVNECQVKKEFPWRYYFINYEIFRPYGWSRYSTKDSGMTDGKEYYLKKAMPTQKIESVSTYLPFDVLFKNCNGIIVARNKDDVVDRNEKIITTNGYVKCFNSYFAIYDEDTNKKNEDIPELKIPQNNVGVDTIDRVQLLKRHLETDWK